MCTVTLVPWEDGFCLAANRDESRLRPIALPPQRRTFGARHAILPIDPQSGGTWIAVNDAGLCLTLLNRHAQLPLSPGPADALSRGVIIPELLSCASVSEAIDRLRGMLDCGFAPFRLVVASRTDLAEVVRDVGPPRIALGARPDNPVMFTSSGLGDALVEGPRRELFQRSLTTPANWLLEQDAFHRHSWPDRQHVSVCMRRSDARTVSYTMIDVGAFEATLIYRGAPPDEDASPVTMSLKVSRFALA